MTLVQLRSSLLENYTTLDRTRLIDVAKELVESDRYTAELAALYLLGQIQRRPELRALFRSKQENPQSRLYQSPLLDRLKAVDSGTSADKGPANKTEAKGREQSAINLSRQIFV
jgi:hypothetical protein